jgi:hypothetical protein
MGNYRRDRRKAVAGSISVNRDLRTLALSSPQFGKGNGWG